VINNNNSINNSNNNNNNNKFKRRSIDDAHGREDWCMRIFGGQT